MHTRMPDQHSVAWRKSSYSQPTQSNCVEVAQIDGTVAIRDSKNPDGPKLFFDANGWATFTRNIRLGRFSI